MPFQRPVQLVVHVEQKENAGLHAVFTPKNLPRVHSALGAKPPIHK